MARIINRRKPLSPKELAERAKKYRVTRTFVWIDPYPEIPGTKPEKMVYAELMRRGIPFHFQEWFHIVSDIYIIEGDSWYKPDFIIPELKMIIEVQGAYWHTKPDQIEKDSYKYALYEQVMGYKVVLWWDYDIEARLQSLFEGEPGLYFRGKPIVPVKRSDQQEYADGKAKNGARLSRRKPWTKPAVRIKIKTKSKPRKGV